MLTPHELQEMQTLVTRVQQGSVSRADWAALAALTLIFQGDLACVAIATAGYDVFKNTCGPVWAGHAFAESDLKAIYARICVAASRAELATPVA